MPYIREQDRHYYEPRSVQVAETPGELNFQLTALVDAYLAERGLSYESLNAAIGALECAKLELYRRLAAPYEDQKIKENGDVYTAGAPK